MRMTTRELSGLVLPYGPVAVRGGRRWRFAPGSLTWPGQVWLLVEHCQACRIGRAVDLADTPAGVTGRFALRPGPAAARAFARAAAGELTGFSAGVDILDVDRPGGGDVVRRAVLREVSLTGVPAYPTARVRPQAGP